MIQLNCWVSLIPFVVVLDFLTVLQNENGLAAIIKLFSCSAHMGMKLIILVNVKMTRIVGILTFMNSINTTSESFKA